ncbi:hypothetical protein JCM10908_001081 [Rhodotorula pacifica]|uniref:uncharacterized protein n=1 Tax=Rhodotorula pacifica TaxID=1495444 RepID=UPI0031762E14
MATPTPAFGSAGNSNNPPPPPLSMAGGPPQQGPSVLQILAMGQERNHAADSIAHHPRIDSLVKLGKEAEATWLQIGQTAEAVSEYDRAIAAYESALRHNAYSVVALSQIAAIYRSREEFKKAAEYFGRVVSIAPESGDVWGALGHCFLMIDDLKKAYSSYQQALYYMPNPHEPKLWYGIGILYDRYGSLEHAEEAFSSVIRMEPNFEKANEIFFRLGIIYKQQRKSAQSLECFRYILNNPPRPLTEIDIWFQIGHVYEQQKDFIAAKESYERVLQENPAHAKVLQQLGGLYHRSQAPFYDPEASVQILTKSLESDPNDPFSWYLLGRAYMTTSNFGKAYEAYQQAVYRDGKNPAFWCSIGVLYYNINQFHDALDAYSRAIRIHPYLAEVWYNLGALYEACNDQMTDAIDAYQRTLQLDPSNSVVTQRLNEIRDHQTSGAALSPPPPPKDISPSSMSWSYATNSGGAPTQLAQAGLGPELSPSMGPPPPSSSVPQGRAPPTSGSGGSPHGNPNRFEGMSISSRPRSTDPYRRSAIQHSPSGFPAGSSPRHAPPSAPGHRLPPYKDGRLQPNGRLGSPPSPRSRVPDGHPPGPSNSYPFPSYLSGPLHPRENGHDAMDWERSRNGLRNGSSAPGSRGSGNLHPPTLGQPHSYPPPPQHHTSPHPSSHPHAHQQHSHQQQPHPYGQPPRTLHDHPAAQQHAPNGAPYDRAGPPHISGATAARPPFFDNPSPGPYGAYPPAGSSAAAEEYARRRSSGSTSGSHRDSKPTIPSLDAAMTAPSVPSPATPAPAPTAAKGRGSRKKAENGTDAPKKGGRRSKAANAGSAAGDSADGSASGANTPKKRRAKAVPKAQKEQAAAAAAAAAVQEKEDEAAAAQAAATLGAGSAVVAPRADGSAQQAKPEPPAKATDEAAAPQREVDEEYDEGVDALMSLGAAAHSEASPPAPAPPAEAENGDESAPLSASNPRKRSLLVEPSSPAATSNGAVAAESQSEQTSEPDAKRARPDPAVPQADAEPVPPASASAPAEKQDSAEEAGVLGPAPTEKANMSADATEETKARKEADEVEHSKTDAGKAAAAPPASEKKDAASSEEDKENVGESTTPDKDKLPASVVTSGPEVVAASASEAGTPKDGEVAAVEAAPAPAAATVPAA